MASSVSSNSSVPRARRRAVVVGGAGFLGRRLVALLSGADEGPRDPGWPRFEEIHVVDCATFPDAHDGAARAPAGIALTHGRLDVRSRPQLEAALTGADTVFHLASVVDVGLRRNPVIEAINVDGTRNVVDACLGQGVRSLVYTSSEDVVFSEVPATNADESRPYPARPMNDYVRTKIEAESLVLGADGTGGLRTCALRPQHIYGPEDPHAIRQSLRAFADRKVPFLFGDGSARFGVVYVDNVAHAHLLAAGGLADAAAREVVGGKAYFVGEDHAPNYFEFLRPFAEARGIAMPKLRLPARGVAALARGMELVHRLTGAEVPFHRFHQRILTSDFYFSHARATRELGYDPIVAPAEAMARTVEWVRSADLSI